MENNAIYPGSFDPITNGHVDIIRRGLKIFDRILVAVLENPKKDPLLTTKERVSLIRKIFKDQENVEVKSFHGLLVEFAKENGTNTVIRGLRAISDFEYEFQMALMNRKLSPEMETLVYDAEPRVLLPQLERSQGGLHARRVRQGPHPRARRDETQRKIWDE